MTCSVSCDPRVLKKGMRTAWALMRAGCTAAGTVAYMAPEVLQMGSLSMSADVYSFAHDHAGAVDGRGHLQGHPGSPGMLQTMPCLSYKNPCAPESLEDFLAAQQGQTEAVGF